jgi:hypothetical protein
MKLLLLDWFNSCFVHEIEWHMKSKNLAFKACLSLTMSGDVFVVLDLISPNIEFSHLFKK